MFILPVAIALVLIHLAYRAGYFSWVYRKSLAARIFRKTMRYTNYDIYVLCMGMTVFVSFFGTHLQLVRILPYWASFILSVLVGAATAFAWAKLNLDYVLEQEHNRLNAIKMARERDNRP